MMAVAAEDVADLVRWVICAAAVVLAHAAVAAGIVSWRQLPETAEPAAAIVIEFAPLPVGPAVRAADVAPGPEQVMSEASPDRPVESREAKTEEQRERKVEARLERTVEDVELNPVEEPPPEIAPAPDPEVALMLPPPEQQRQEATREPSQMQAPSAPSPTTSAPVVAPEEIAPIAAAPEQGPVTRRDSRGVQAWQTKVVTLLERNKRYPPAAQSRRQQGVAQLFFNLDRQGRVIDSRVVRSSGAAVLDQEALTLLRRAQPFPPPPPELPGDRVGVSVPIRFNLK